MSRKLFVFSGALVVVFSLALAMFGMTVSADEPNSPATVGWTGVPKHIAGESWKQSGVLFDKGGLKVAQDVQIVATVGTEMITVTAKAGDFGIQTTKVYTRAGELPVRVVYSGTVLFSGKTTISSAAVAKVDTFGCDCIYEAGEDLSFGFWLLDKFGNRILNPTTAENVWYRIDLPYASPIIATKQVSTTDSFPFYTEAVSTTKTGLVGFTACVEGFCGSLQRTIVAAGVVSLTVNAPMTVTTGSQFEVGSKGTDKFGNASSENVQYNWQSADSNGDLTSMFGESIVINAGLAAGAMDITAKSGAVEVKVNVAVVEKAEVASAAEWKAIPASAMSDEVKPGATIKVVSGMTYWELASKAYGDGSKWQTIANADKTPGLQIGESLIVPAL